MIRAAELTKDDTVLEAGPGTGALTYPLAARAGRVIAVEKDERIADLLAADVKDRGITNVEIVKGDILKFHWGERGNPGLKTSLPNPQCPIPNSQSPVPGYKFVSCIPYYLTSRLMRLLLETPRPPSVIVLTIQKEVSERITARPPQMNLLGLAVQIYAESQIMKDVPADCFRPRPKVDSTIIKIVPRPETHLAQRGICAAEFFTLAKKAFGQKRKMLGRSLQEYAPALPVWVQKKRPQELAVGEWVELVAGIRAATR